MSLLPVSETTASRSPSSSCYPSMPADKVLSRPWPRAGSALFVSKATRATNPVCPIYTQSQKLPRIHGVKFGSRFFGSSEAFSWVTVGHGKLRAATNGHMDIVFQGGVPIVSSTLNPSIGRGIRASSRKPQRAAYQRYAAEPLRDVRNLVPHDGVDHLQPLSRDGLEGLAVRHAAVAAPRVVLAPAAVRARQAVA